MSNTTCVGESKVVVVVVVLAAIALVTDSAIFTKILDEFKIMYSLQLVPIQEHYSSKPGSFTGVNTAGY